MGTTLLRTQATQTTETPDLDVARARIVVAEDSSELRRIVARQLELEGYEVVALEDGRKLSTYLAAALSGGVFNGRPAQVPDLIISDIEMPGASGIEVLTELRGTGSTIPVILASGLRDPRLTEKAAALSAFVLDKPFTRGALTETVVRLLQKRTAEIEQLRRLEASGPDTSAGLGFRDRAYCILCGGTDLRPLWSGRFDEEPVSSWLLELDYDADVDLALAEETFERVACRDCEMSFHRRVLDEASTIRLYEQWISQRQIEALEASAQSSDPESTFRDGVQLVKHLLGLKRLLRSKEPGRVRVLDFGCGDGRFLRAASLLGFEAHGVDLSASRRSQAERSGIRVAGSLAELDPIVSDGFDAVTLFDVLQSLAGPLSTLKELGRRLRPGGILIVEVLDCEAIDVPSSFSEFQAVHPLERINHFTPHTLRAMCTRAGFVQVPKPPAHVTNRPLAVLGSEAARLLSRPSTSQYFHLPH